MTGVVGIGVAAELATLEDPAGLSVGSTLMSGILVSETAVAPGPSAAPGAESVGGTASLVCESNLASTDDDALAEDVSGEEAPGHRHPMAKPEEMQPERKEGIEQDLPLGRERAVGSTLTVLIVIGAPDAAEAGTVSFPPADPTPDPEAEGSTLDTALEPESESVAITDTVAEPVGVADGLVVESTMTVSPGPVGVSLTTGTEG